VLAVAGLTRRPAWRVLALAMATVGAVIAVYHVLVERFPSLESSTCDPTNPCSLVWFERLGFVTLPYMALSGFALVGALLLTVGLRAPAPTAADVDHDRDRDEGDDHRARGARSTRPSIPPTPSDASPAIPVLEENLS